MMGIADASLWLALAATALAFGIGAGRWPERSSPSRLADVLLLVAAGATIVSWSATAGTLLGNGQPPALLAASVPIRVGPVYRLATLWSTLPGAALTAATLLLAAVALRLPNGAGPATVPAMGSDPIARARHSTILAAVAAVCIATAAWFAPDATPPARIIPAFVQGPAAAAAPLLALIAITGTVLVISWSVARPVGAPIPRQALAVSWIAATGAVAAEQVARAGLGIGPSDPVVLGTASSGLLLWLAISALLHGRVQRLVFRHERPRVRRPLVTRAAHAGAALLGISFGMHILAARSTVRLPAGVPVEVRDSFRRTWTLVNQGVSRYDAEGVEVTAAALEAVGPKGGKHLLAPEIREYHGWDGEHLESTVGIRRSTVGLVMEARVLLTESDSSDSAGVRVTFLPLPVLWPAGIVLLALSFVAMVSAAGSNREDGVATP